MNKHCKNCEKELLYETSFRGLRDFCDEDCRKEYRLEYKRRKQQEYRESDVDNSSNGNGRYPQNVDNKNPLISRHSGGQKEEPVTSEKVSKDRHSKRDRELEKLASKICCNYPTAQREGFCITLNEPCQALEKYCPNCPILMKLISHTMRL